MQIILLHSRFKRVRSITISGFQLACLLVLLSSGIAASATLVMQSLRHQDVTKQASHVSEERYIKQNLNAMAAKLGVMQAQLMRLDALGERIQGLAGVKPEAFNFNEAPGRGGPEHSSVWSESGPVVDMDSFQRALDTMNRDVEHRTDYFNVVEMSLLNDRTLSKLVPTNQPVDVSYNASGFGWRLDPFSGRSAFHDGIDFAAPVGTDITAAAGGVVTNAAFHHDYGNMLEIDHGNNIVTRYAHASRLFVKVGDIVKPGQVIAAVGSTGRSTGAHLHFEVLVGGVAQNPEKFLAAGTHQVGAGSRVASVAGK